MTNVRRKYIWVGLTILSWYISSSVLIASNKVLFDLLDIEIPLLVTFVHFSFTSLVLAAIRLRRPQIFGSVHVTPTEFVTSILPVAVCTAGDVGLSNMAYSRVPVSVMTILKSSAPVCIYTAAVLLGMERFQLRTSAVCFIIAASVALAVPNAESIDQQSGEYVSGVFMVVIAIACLSVRWVFIQSLTRKYSPIQLLCLIQPTSALVLIPIAIFTELNTSLARIIDSSRSMILPIVLMMGSSLAAMSLLLSEYKIVHDTTSLTLSVAGIGKEILTFAISLVFFSESFTMRQSVGISISIVGIFLYGLIRTKQPLEDRVDTPDYEVVSVDGPQGEVRKSPRRKDVDEIE